MEFAKRDEEARERRRRLFWSYLSSTDLAEWRKGREMGMPVSHRLHLAKINSRWLRTPIQCTTRLTIINKAIITLNPIEGSRANSLECRILGSLLSSHLSLSLYFFFFLFLSLSLTRPLYLFPTMWTLLETDIYMFLFVPKLIALSWVVYVPRDARDE